MKLKLTTNAEGWITAFEQDKEDGVEVADALAKAIILGASKITDGKLSYREAITVDGDGFITGYGTTPDGDQELLAEEAEGIVLGASKLVNGSIMTDDAKVDELKAAAAKVTPSAEQQMIAALALQVAQLKGAQA